MELWESSLARIHSFVRSFVYIANILPLRDPTSRSTTIINLLIHLPSTVSKRQNTVLSWVIKIEGTLRQARATLFTSSTIPSLLSSIVAANWNEPKPNYPTSQEPSPILIRSHTQSQCRAQKRSPRRLSLTAPPTSCKFTTHMP